MASSQLWYEITVLEDRSTTTSVNQRVIRNSSFARHGAPHLWWSFVVLRRPWYVLRPFIKKELSSFIADDGFLGFHTRDPRDVGPQRIPDAPPYLAHLGNLDYEVTKGDVQDFFADCEVKEVRIVEDRETQRPKGFGYVEFVTVEGLKKALEMDGQSFMNRNLRVRIADPRRCLYFCIYVLGQTLTCF